MNSVLYKSLLGEHKWSFTIFHVFRSILLHVFTELATRTYRAYLFIKSDRLQYVICLLFLTFTTKDLANLVEMNEKINIVLSEETDSVGLYFCVTEGI